MRIVILGAGQVGSTVAERLCEENQHDITVVDQDPAVLQELSSQTDIRTIVGHASHPNTLRRAGIEDAELLIAATDSDETNIVASQIAYTLYNMRNKIARIRSIEYMRETALFSPEHMPIDVPISPERLVTEHIQRIIEHPGALQVLDFAGGKVRLVGAEVTESAPMNGRALSGLSKLLGGIDTRVVAIYRGNEPIIPQGDTIVERHDLVFFIAERPKTSLVMAQFHDREEPCRRVMIAGGGNIGLQLARNLERFYRVKIIEQRLGRAEYLGTELSSAMVLHGDAANTAMLIEENIADMDVFCALTNDDEANILSAMLAKNKGARKVMSLINRPEYIELVEDRLVDVAISPQQITIGAILRRVRRGKVEAVYSLRRGAAEALEGIAIGNAEQSSLTGRSVGELELPPSASLGAVVRGEAVLMAHHDIVIEENDRLIVLVTDKAEVAEVSRRFQPSALY